MQHEGERLSRFLAHAGIASRRHAEELIAAGRVQVNGKTIATQGYKINPDRDEILVDGRPVRETSKKAYLLLNKPTGYLTTVSDPQGRPTVIDLLPQEIRRLRVYPVGRLDLDSSGLLILTNDGDFAQKMLHPSNEIDKRYHVVTDANIPHAAIQRLRYGVSITEDDGRRYKVGPVQLRVIKRDIDGSHLEIVIHEGRKRQIRRMLQEVGFRVDSLTRIGFGSLTLGNLKAGEWRNLTSREITGLIAQATISSETRQANNKRRVVSKNL